jgi:hypothetical protein
MLYPSSGGNGMSYQNGGQYLCQPVGPLSLPLATFGTAPIAVTPAYASSYILGNGNYTGSFYQALPLQASSFTQLLTDVPVNGNGSTGIVMGGGTHVVQLQRPPNSDAFTPAQFQQLANSVLGTPKKSNSLSNTNVPTNMTLTLHYEPEQQ